MRDCKFVRGMFLVASYILGNISNLEYQSSNLEYQTNINKHGYKLHTKPNVN